MLQQIEALIRSHSILLIPVIIVGFLVYFLPSIVAFARRHVRMKELFAVNVAVGWNEVAWFGILVWAITGHRKEGTPESD